MSAQDRARPAPLLRHAALRQRHPCLRELSRAGARLHRRPRARRRLDRRAHPRSAMGLANVATTRRSAGPIRAAERSRRRRSCRCSTSIPIEMGLDGPRATEMLARFAAAATARDSRAAFPDERSAGQLATSSRRSPPSSARCCPATRRSTAISTGDRAAMSAERPSAAWSCSSPSRARVLPLPRRLQPLGTGRRSTARRTAPSARLHNTGLYNVDGEGAYPRRDRGLSRSPTSPTDMGRFRAPTLRNVAVTAPYMHDGSVATLEAVVDHYASGGRRSAFRSDRPERAFTLTPSEQTADLLAFLESLTDQAFSRRIRRSRHRADFPLLARACACRLSRRLRRLWRPSAAQRHDDTTTRRRTASSLRRIASRWRHRASRGGRSEDRSDHEQPFFA